MQQITLTIASRLDAVPLLGQLVSSMCSSAGFSPVEGSRVEVCVVEAVNNVIKHAYGEDPGRAVEVEISLFPDKLVFDVLDSGRSADSAENLHADYRHAFDVDGDHLDELPESGRGLAIIQEVMDSFEYSSSPERNRFRLTKRLKK